MEEGSGLGLVSLYNTWIRSTATIPGQIWQQYEGPQMAFLNNRCQHDDLGLILNHDKTIWPMDTQLIGPSPHPLPERRVKNEWILMASESE